MAYKTPEQIAATLLLPLGFILTNDRMLPFEFTDKDGTNFKAMADFYHPGLDLHVEIKHDHLNGKTSKANAERAYNSVEPWRLAKHPTYYQVQHQWNHAAPKHAIVQSVIGPSQYVVAFTKMPDAETIKRIEKQGIQAYSITGLARMLKLQLGFNGMLPMP